MTFEDEIRSAEQKIKDKWKATGLLESLPEEASKTSLAMILNNTAGARFLDTTSEKEWLDMDFVIPVIVRVIKDLVNHLGPENVEHTGAPASLDHRQNAFVVFSSRLPRIKNMDPETQRTITPEAYADMITNFILEDYLAKSWCAETGLLRLYIYSFGFSKEFPHIRMALRS